MALQRQNFVIDEQQETDVHQDHKENTKGLTLLGEGAPIAEHKEYPRQVCKNATANCNETCPLKDQKDSIEQCRAKYPAKKFLFHHLLPRFFLDSCAIIDHSMNGRA